MRSIWLRDTKFIAVAAMLVNEFIREKNGSSSEGDDDVGPVLSVSLANQPSASGS
jgi:hypothetical protein